MQKDHSQNFSDLPVLDEKLNFVEQIQSKISKCNKPTGIIKTLSTTCARDALLAICKSFIRPSLDFADILYNKLTMIQLKLKMFNRAYMAITGAIYSRKKRENLIRN